MYAWSARTAWICGVCADCFVREPAAYGSSMDPQGGGERCEVRGDVGLGISSRNDRSLFRRRIQR